MLSGKSEPADIADVFLDYGMQTVVLKLGVYGCYAKIAESELTVPAFKVPEVVDTLSAADAFTTGFIAATVAGWDIEKPAHLQMRQGPAASVPRAVPASYRWR